MRRARILRAAVENANARRESTVCEAAEELASHTRWGATEGVHVQAAERTVAKSSDKGEDAELPEA
jgi:hypothetical protein